MRILLIHNYYQQAGGEDKVFQAEKALLECADHQVLVYERDNVEITHYSTPQKGSLLWRTIWARDSANHLRSVLRQERPRIVHFHNTFPLISPAAYIPCQEFGIPVVQTLHNYRLLCPTATFFHDEQVCEDCLGKAFPWPAVVYGCYRHSRSQTTVTALMLAAHRWLKTWERQVDIYVALTEFSRRKFVEGGLPAERIAVKPNFLHPDPGICEGERDYVLFVGRLSVEKGIDTLLEAWSSLYGVPLRVVGDGPLANRIASLVQESKLEAIEFLGKRAHRTVMALMKRARFVVFPSECYENFPLVIVEAFACGTPVIASRLGAMAEIVEDGRTGLLFTPGDDEELAEKVDWAWTHPRQMAKMGREARQEFEEKYTAERNYEMLMAIYKKAAENARK